MSSIEQQPGSSPWGRRAPGLLLALALLPVACAYTLLEAEPSEEEQGEQEDQGTLEPILARANVVTTALGTTPEPARTLEATAPDPEPEPEPEPEPPPPPTPEEIQQLLDEAQASLRANEVSLRPRSQARGPLPAGSELRQAYAEGRAINFEGRSEQIRQWTALAKFASREPGPRLRPGPLARYDLVVTVDKHKSYLHVVVPAAGLAPEGQVGRHESWVGGERWIALADRLVPGSDYLPFKTNGKESLHRQWGKAVFVDAVAGIAHDYRQRTGLLLGIGDLSHVDGGKIEDHWTHQKGVDVDLYLIDPAVTEADGRPRVWWSHVKRGQSLWTSKAKGKGEHEPRLDPEDELSLTPTSQRLQVLAQIVFTVDEIAYFVHNDPMVLAPFDEQVGERRPGRRFLHDKNRGYWPAHADHVHLRWVEGKLPVDVTPRP